MTVAVVLTKSAQKDVSKLPVFVQAAAAAEFVRLVDYPNVTGVKAMQGAWKGHYRTVIAKNYRVIFTLSTGTITVVRVRNRKEAY